MKRGMWLGASSSRLLYSAARRAPINMAVCSKVAPLSSSLALSDRTLRF